MVSNGSVEISKTEDLIVAIEKTNHKLREHNKHLQNVINESAVKQAKLITAAAGFEKFLKEFLQDNLVVFEPIRKEKGLL